MLGPCGSRDGMVVSEIGPVPELYCARNDAVAEREERNREVE